MSRLRTVALTKRFNNITAVDHLNIELKAGEIFVLLGPNGAGKTTTLKLIVGLLKPDCGQIYIEDIDCQKEPERAKARIGYISDNPFIYQRLTGREFLYFVGGIFKIPRPVYERKIEEIIKLLDIGAWIDLPAGEYSHGMRQKIVLAQAMLHDPLLYIIDEPLVGLDPKSIKVVKEIFQAERSQGKTFFISTHLLSLTEEIADRIGIINHGQLKFVGSLSELKRLAGQEDIEDMYLKLTSEVKQ
ncbi:MAG: ABC transporter ATP-binding protein [candidate division WOR-3 bacterium]